MRLHRFLVGVLDLWFFVPIFLVSLCLVSFAVQGFA
jgi:hypothetical protein